MDIQVSKQNRVTRRGITLKSIADYCVVSDSTVRRWIKGGKLSAIKLPSGHYHVRVADFRDFLERYDMPIKGELFESKYKGKEVI